jgi:two-component system chemotaxis response regulator CheB
MIRVLIVDDSATMRAVIARALSQDPGITVVGEAADPLQARVAIKELNPDVLTLDVEMPQMNGLDFLERLMRLRPMPVVMVSTLTSHGAEATLRALELGAVDCVAKPQLGDHTTFDRIASIVRAAAGARLRPLRNKPPAPASKNYLPGDRMLAIGASTGGVEALLAILSSFPENCPPTVITQHMPGTFTASFAKRLDRSCAASVTEAVNGAPLSIGHIYLAPGGAAHLEVAGSAGAWRCRLREGDTVSGHRPSVDVLFSSVAVTAGVRSVGMILTGMGRDGARGLLAMRSAGAATFGQDEATSVVYGMPKSAFEDGAVATQLPLHNAAAAMLSACTAKSGERSCRPLLPSRC